VKGNRPDKALSPVGQEAKRQRQDKQWNRRRPDVGVKDSEEHRRAVDGVGRLRPINPAPGQPAIEPRERDHAQNKERRFQLPQQSLPTSCPEFVDDARLAQNYRQQKGRTESGLAAPRPAREPLLNEPTKEEFFHDRRDQYRHGHEQDPLDRHWAHPKQLFQGVCFRRALVQPNKPRVHESQHQEDCRRHQQPAAPAEEQIRRKSVSSESNLIGPAIAHEANEIEHRRNAKWRGENGAPDAGPPLTQFFHVRLHEVRAVNPGKQTGRV
jgi:hypothetical protein